MFVSNIFIFLTFFINICFDLPIKLSGELAEAEQCADIELWKKMKNQQKVELYRVLQT